MDRPLRLITASPVDQLARTIEALLVVASQPLTVAELVEAAADEQERVETALGLLRERYSEGRSGIVLEQVAGGWAFRAAREAAEACGRLFERPVQRSLSQASLETLAIVAYLGPCTRPDVARIRGVSADSAVANLVERGLISEAGRDDGVGGAIRYRTTPLFERVFGLESLSELPRLDDLGGDVDEIRDRLVSVAEKRPAELLESLGPAAANAPPSVPERRADRVSGTRDSRPSQRVELRDDFAAEQLDRLEVLVADVLQHHALDADLLEPAETFDQLLGRAGGAAGARAFHRFFR